MKSLFDPEILITAVKGTVGVSATTGGIYVSILPKVEAWLRLISLVIGCAVGVATFVSIIRKHKHKAAVPPPHKSKNNETKKQS